MKEKLLPEIEQIVNKTLSAWSTQASMEVKHAASVLVLDFSAKQIINYDDNKSFESLNKTYSRIMQGFMSFPLNIPGTSYNQCVKDKRKIIAMLRDMLEERRASLETNRGDFLDQISKDVDKEKFLSEDFIAEHETILKNREDPNSSQTWDEYKSMTFTLQVINETLRLGNVAPGLLRKALKDIRVKDDIVDHYLTFFALVYKRKLLNLPSEYMGIDFYSLTLS
ncbi:Cytochrome P450 87A3 [Morus notabilis]|uniref:Cytochrome P450 87A3 n=1 Tax=Morus notabilis TaxID=981085 RepID=W9S8R0_9ROSA|nr:Cytochrome P450 87A3 [Morus notabilis]